MKISKKLAKELKEEIIMMISFTYITMVLKFYQ